MSTEIRNQRAGRDAVAVAVLDSHVAFEGSNALTLRFEAEAIHPNGLTMAEMMFPGGFQAYISRTDQMPLEPAQIERVRDWLASAPDVTDFVLEGPMSWAELDTAIRASDDLYPKCKLRAPGDP